MNHSPFTVTMPDWRGIVLQEMTSFHVVGERLLQSFNAMPSFRMLSSARTQPQHKDYCQSVHVIPELESLYQS